jgi:hypothetical protein
MDGYILRFQGEDYDLQSLNFDVEKLAQLLHARKEDSNFCFQLDAYYRPFSLWQQVQLLIF